MSSQVFNTFVWFIRRAILLCTVTYPFLTITSLLLTVTYFLLTVTYLLLTVTYLWQVEREKLMHEERMCRSESEKSNLNTSLARLEEENMDMQRQIQSLQAQLSELESQHAQRSVVSAVRQQLTFMMSISSCGLILAVVLRWLWKTSSKIFSQWLFVFSAQYCCSYCNSFIMQTVELPSLSMTALSWIWRIIWVLLSIIIDH